MALKVLLCLSLHFTLIILCYQLCKPAFSGLAKQSARLFDTFLNKRLEEDEHLKKLWILNIRLIVWFLFFGGCLGLGLFIAFLPFDWLEIPIELGMQWKEWLTVSIVFSLFLLLFNRNRNSDYNYWKRLLHELVLAHKEIGKWLFNKAKRKVTKEDKPYLIVTGLARSGTTAVLNNLMATNLFNSLSYKDMPFVMSPGFMNGFLRNSKPKQERAHGDNLLVNEESVEAFEEVFFKAQLNDEFISESNLNIHKLSESLVEDYAYFRSLVTKRERLYLAKNNNSILRLKSLLNQDENLRVVLMFRDPIQQAISLKKQHELFGFLQEDDAFAVNYMDWLGHHEFGLNHKPFEFGITNEYDSSSLNYWLTHWCAYYEYVLKEFSENKQVKLVSFDSLCNHPNETIEEVGVLLGIKFPAQKFPDFKPAAKAGEVDKKLKQKSLELYNRLKAITESSDK